MANIRAELQEKLQAAQAAGEWVVLMKPEEWGGKARFLAANQTMGQLRKYHIERVRPNTTVLRESYFPRTKSISVLNKTLATRKEWEAAIEEWEKEIAWEILSQSSGRA
ncbi:MAG TPA: hypothetical protein VFM18_17595 [Methanosarcina sp.]|nr:hypothetical protein [Methanosarcina sp.]